MYAVLSLAKVCQHPLFMCTESYACMQKPKKELPQAALDAQDKEKPKTTKAERRAKQEAERAAKEAGVVKVGYICLSGRLAMAVSPGCGARQWLCYTLKLLYA